MMLEAIRSQHLSLAQGVDGPRSVADRHPELAEGRQSRCVVRVAHDYLHLRQISKRMYQLAERDAGDYSIRYAGEWRA